MYQRADEDTTQIAKLCTNKSEWVNRRTFSLLVSDPIFCAKASAGFRAARASPPGQYRIAQPPTVLCNFKLRNGKAPRQIARFPMNGVVI